MVKVMNTTTNQVSATETSHPFEAAGLGRAPFRYLGIEAQDIAYGEAVLDRGDKSGVMITTKPGGSCALCGTYIVEMHQFRSSDGRTFHVGSDCVEKHLASRAASRKLVAAVQKASRTRATTARHAREAEKIAAGAALLARPDVIAALAAQPSPTAWRAAQGDTRLNDVEWRWGRSGAAGRVRIAAELARFAAELAPAATAEA